MRICVAVIGLLVAGCGGRSVPIPAAQVPVPQETVMVPLTEEPQFNGKDINETFLWAWQRAKYLSDKEGPAFEAVGKNALNDEPMVAFQQDLQKFRDDLESHVGEFIEWQTRVGRITKRGLTNSNIFLKMPFDDTARRGFLGLYLSVNFAEGDKYEETRDHGLLPLGTSISFDFAKTLKPMDKININGKIIKVKFDGFYNHLQVTTLSIDVGGAKVGEKP